MKANDFAALLRQSIEREVTTPRIGAFLSGGTDSSTVVGLLGQVTGEPVDCFSIGFDASGYDEMSYARLAARHFNSKLHEHYITPDELLRAIPAGCRSLRSAVWQFIRTAGLLLRPPRARASGRKVAGRRWR